MSNEVLLFPSFFLSLFHLLESLFLSFFTPPCVLAPRRWVPFVDRPRYHSQRESLCSPPKDIDVCNGYGNEPEPSTSTSTSTSTYSNKKTCQGQGMASKTRARRAALLLLLRRQRRKGKGQAQVEPRGSGKDCHGAGGGGGHEQGRRRWKNSLAGNTERCSIKKLLEQFVGSASEETMEFSTFPAHPELSQVERTRILPRIVSAPPSPRPSRPPNKPSPSQPRKRSVRRHRTEDEQRKWIFQNYCTYLSDPKTLQKFRRNPMKVRARLRAYERADDACGLDWIRAEQSRAHHRKAKRRVPRLVRRPTRTSRRSWMGSGRTSVRGTPTARTTRKRSIYYYLHPDVVPASIDV
mmetsp:Transcript_1423/g.3640  ORF Transcript_1423/g.3640 Transcript_1423/m.3640 type:complete len:351 (-) Transcript_1423:228-1280(-)